MVNKKFLMSLFFGLVLIICSYGVMAAPTLNSPVANGNYSSSTVTLSCTSAITNTTSVEFYFNSTGGTANRTASNLITTVTNTSMTQTEFNVSWNFNATAMAESRTYNISCIAINATNYDGGFASANAIRIDYTAPNATGFTVQGVTHYYNYSTDYGTPDGMIYLNVSVNDSLDTSSAVGSPNITVYFNITTSAGVQSAIYTASNWSTWWNASLNTSDLSDDDVYNVTAFVKDPSGNTNSSEVIYNIIFDSYAPGVTFSCDSTSTTYGSAVACTCTAVDASSTTITYNATPSTSYIGSRTQACRVVDAFGIDTTSTVTISVTAGSAASSSGGSTTASWSMTYSVANGQLGEGYTRQLQAKERIKVTVAGGTHHVGVKSISGTKATIEIASNPVEITLDVGEDAKIDVDDDGTYDLFVTLNEIVNGKADVTVKEISEEVPEGEGVVSTSGDVESIGGEEVNQGMSTTWWWIIGIVVVLVLIGVGVKAKKK